MENLSKNDKKIGDKIEDMVVLSDEEIEKYRDEIKDEVDEEMLKQGLIFIKDGEKLPTFGSIHTRWKIEKRILKERYNIDWKTPDETNSFINFD